MQHKVTMADYNTLTFTN
jgi:pimeloyl-ACP methyl ester carboxylesterase